ncbi:asparagine synthase-related protein [Aquimarina pacifica]|uniref:asparagine synthase-related protein n=1 Tax=Aquimarina pacifica TaxID=1296415 RepID=UPI00046F1BBC|nr:asparagine synthase-related protein [Aquimarina pacifica]
MIDDFIIRNQLEKTDVIFDNFKSRIELSKDLILYTNSVYSKCQKNDTQIIIIGDYIGDQETLLNSKSEDIPKLRGNFYAIVSQNKSVTLYSSFFSILPIYYKVDQSIVSSSINLIRKYSPQKYRLDKKFILENLLFNYGFFDRTLYQEIKLLPCHSSIQFAKNKQHDVLINKHLRIDELFSSSPRKGKTANELSDMFIETTQHYFPEEPFDIAFTSGFDGRTLVSCAMYHDKKFATFSFGREEIDDVRVPKTNAKQLNIPYQSYDISSEKYLENEYYNNAHEYSTNGYMGNGFLQAHYIYSTKKISERSKYMLSGYVGSELFRALHATGTVTSVALKNLFTISDENTIRTKLKTSIALNVLNKKEFVNELNELVEEILAYKRNLSQKNTLNQQFYTFVFEETVRKFFGQKITTQQRYINVRTPFLDYQFVKTLLQTKYAGTNNDFFTQNPLKRTKGQYIYSDIIRKTNAVIYRQMTGKGYRPIDVRNMFYMINIVYPFFKKRFVKKVKKTYMDNFGIVTGVLKHKEKLRPYITKSIYFDHKKLNQMLDALTVYSPEKERDTLLLSLSILKNIDSTPEKKQQVNKMVGST